MEIPKTCPCINNKHYDCRQADWEKGDGKCFDEKYLQCCAFSSWFWYQVAKNQALNN